MFGARKFARDVKDDESGTIAIMFAVSAMAILAMIGLVVDGSRAITMSQQTVASLDTAALAAAKQMTLGVSDKDKLEKVGRDFFEKNFDAVGKAPDVKVDEFNFDANLATNTVTIQATSSIPTTFGSLVGVKRLTSTRTSTVTYNVQDIEIGLMLDVTGSMRGAKLASLKNSVELLADTLMSDRGAGTVKIGLAPYSSSVNLGDFADQVSNGTSTDGCVVSRNLNKDSDAAPENDDTYFRSIQTANTELNEATGSAVPYHNYYCPDAKVLPLTDNKRTLVDTVKGYDADGYTGGHLGIAWAWHLVSPKWGDIWGGSSRPKPYGTANNIKAVVLMTDGKFNISYENINDFAANSLNPARGDVAYQQTEDLCKAIRDENVLVFSIGFKLDSAKATDALKDCASTDPNDTNVKYFYSADNEDELKQAYLDIAIRLQNLRVAK